MKLGLCRVSWLHISRALRRPDSKERDGTGKPFQFRGLELLEAIRPVVARGQADDAGLCEDLTCLGSIRQT